MEIESDMPIFSISGEILKAQTFRMFLVVHFGALRQIRNRSTKKHVDKDTFITIDYVALFLT